MLILNLHILTCQRIVLLMEFIGYNRTSVPDRLHFQIFIFSFDFMFHTSLHCFGVTIPWLLPQWECFLASCQKLYKVMTTVYMDRVVLCLCYDLHFFYLIHSEFIYCITGVEPLWDEVVGHFLEVMMFNISLVTYDCSTIYILLDITGIFCSLQIILISIYEIWDLMHWINQYVLF